MNQDVIEGLFGIGDEDYLELGQLLYQQDYSADALNFIENHARILHYWKEGEHNLLPPNTTGKGRRKYSFLDLVWLGIVKELRDFGMEKSAINNLKEALFKTGATDVLMESAAKNPAKVLTMLQKQMGVTAIQAKALLDLIEKNTEMLRQLKPTYLFNYVANVLMRKAPSYLLVNKEGDHLPFEDNADPTDEGVALINRLRGATHISLCINTVISQFLSKSYIQSKLAEQVYSEEERTLIELLRKETPKSATVHFKANGKMERIDITQELKVDAAARLTEIMLAGGYEDIVIVTQNGKPVACKKTQKHKL